VSKEKKKQALSDERIRNAICQIAIAFLVMNLSTRLRRVFCLFLCRSGKTTLVFGLTIIKTYKLGNSLLPKLIFNSA